MKKQQSNIILANWKMNLSTFESVGLAKKIVKGWSEIKTKDNKKPDFELVLCPSFPAIALVEQVIKKSDIKLGAQNVFWKQVGPYTGEVSPEVLREIGVSYVVVGHSERRQYLKETDVMVQHKLLAVLAQSLTPVLCVGETFSERQAGHKNIVVGRQVQAALAGVELGIEQQLVVAYEPVWVIGSGQAITHQEMVETAKVIKQVLIDMWPLEVVERQVRIIYGGSVDANNIMTCVGEEPLSGVLVGGASQDYNRLLPLLKQLAKA